MREAGPTHSSLWEGQLSHHRAVEWLRTAARLGKETFTAHGGLSQPNENSSGSDHSVDISKLSGDQPRTPRGLRCDKTNAGEKLRLKTWWTPGSSR